MPNGLWVLKATYSFRCIIPCIYQVIVSVHFGERVLEIAILVTNLDRNPTVFCRVEESL